jgi:tight adherence protein C
MDLTVIALAGVLLLGAGVAILVVNLRKSGGPGVLDQIGTYGYVAEATGGSELEAPARRPLDSLAGRMGDIAAKRLEFGEAELRQKLISAGMYDTTPRKILGYQVLLAVGFAVLTFWFVTAAGWSIVWLIGLTIAAGVVGWLMPQRYIAGRRERRFERIDRQMPDMIDLLVVTVEAGLGILASMRVAGETLKEPLGQELRLTLQEQRMGLSLSEALESLGRRADTPNVRLFVRALTQGERLGVSIGSTLRGLALEMRKRRRAAAEETAQKMPLKMLFPMIFLIFPAMFIILLVPVAINIFDVFSGGGG